MKLFIDTAMIEEIREAQAMGILDGVTTNPSLVSKTGKTFREVLDEILEVVNGPVSAEVTATDFEGIKKEARQLASIHENIVVKIPIIREGLKAIRWSASEGIKVNVTLCFNPMQAMLAAKAGAAYISPFIGRIDDISVSGMELIHQIRAIYDNYGYDTEILAASIRHPMHVVESALAGADAATVPFGVREKVPK
jgi:transaldolase